MERRSRVPIEVDDVRKPYEKYVETRYERKADEERQSRKRITTEKDRILRHDGRYE